MNNLDKPDEDALSAAARSYSLNGFIKVSNIFSNAEVNAITELYDEQHKSAGHYISSNNELRIPPIGSLLENSPELTELIFRKVDLFNTLKAAAGSDVQFAGSDAVHVYNDSIGIHRDTFYEFDFPKVLIFLSDAPTKARFANREEQSHGGAFMVMPGTHMADDKYAAISSTLCNWPYDRDEYYAYSNPNFKFVGAGGGQFDHRKVLTQERRNRDKYTAFTKLSFRKGDVVIFSTRALHALYPLFELDSTGHSADSHQSRGQKAPSKPCYEPIKLLGVLFIEGFSKRYGKTIENAISHEESNLGTLVDYASTVYNLRLYNTIVDHRESPTEAIANVSQKEMGLNRNVLYIGNDIAREEVERCNLIHRFYSRHARLIDNSAGRDAKEIHDKFLRVLRNHDEVNAQIARKIEENVARIVANQNHDNRTSLQSITRKEWKGPAKYLPMINNERIYLAYKRLARIFRL